VDLYLPGGTAATVLVLVLSVLSRDVIASVSPVKIGHRRMEIMLQVGARWCNLSLVLGRCKFY
jgi:hypothetical protein